VEQDAEFLLWLSQRLIYFHGYDPNDKVISNLQNIANRIVSKRYLSISNDDLDKILSHYYVDFYLEKGADDHLNIGYNNQERRKLREVTRSLVTDIINLNVPTQSIIKDN